MNRYSPDSEPATERLFLIQYVNKYNDANYGRIEANVVRRALADHPDPDNPDRIVYNDGRVASGYRNCSWSSGKKNALFVEDLVATCQFDLQSDEKVYGADIRFMPYSVDFRDAEKMVETFRKVQRKMDEYYHDFGSPANYADFLRRVAKALGISKFLMFPKDAGSGLENPRIREFDATSVDYIVDTLVKQARNK